MRSVARVVLVIVVAASGPLLSACDSLSLDNLELWDSKKKLAGDRKPLFPEGVPGVSSGVPPELVKGYREPEGSGMVDPARVAAEAAADSDAKPKKPPAHRTASNKPKPKPAAEPQPQAAAAPPPAPPAQSGGWPAPQPQAPWPGAR